MTPALRLIEADRNAALARQRLSATVTELQARLDPSRLADQALNEVKAAGTASIAVADQNRAAVIGTGAAIGLFLARRPLLRLFRSKPEPEPASNFIPLVQGPDHDRS